MIDRFVQFESGRRAVAIKAVTAAEEAVFSYYPGFPIYPPSLIVEGIAQTAGLLVGEANEFREHVILAKVSRATFHCLACAGDTLTFTGEIEDLKRGGAVANGTSHIGDRLQAEVSLLFAHLDERFAEVELFDPTDLVKRLRALRLFEIGRDREGRLLQPPPHILAAEAAERAS